MLGNVVSITSRLASQYLWFIIQLSKQWSPLNRKIKVIKPPQQLSVLLSLLPFFRGSFQMHHKFTFSKILGV